MMRGAMLIAASLALAGCMTSSSVRPATTTASAADLAAIDRAITEVYAVISGPAGQKRDFDRMRSMFAPDALLRSLSANGLQGGTLDQFIARSGPVFEREGFTERELARRVEVYGNLAHAWSSYDGGSASGAIQVRGINSFQLVRINGRWLIASILWQPETSEFPLPSDMNPER